MFDFLRKHRSSAILTRWLFGLWCYCFDVFFHWTNTGSALRINDSSLPRVMNAVQREWWSHSHFLVHYFSDDTVCHVKHLCPIDRDTNANYMQLYRHCKMNFQTNSCSYGYFIFSWRINIPRKKLHQTLSISFFIQLWFKQKSECLKFVRKVSSLII